MTERLGQLLSLRSPLTWGKIVLLSSTNLLLSVQRQLSKVKKNVKHFKHSKTNGVTETISCNWFSLASVTTRIMLLLSPRYLRFIICYRPTIVNWFFTVEMQKKRKYVTNVEIQIMKMLRFEWLPRQRGRIGLGRFKDNWVWISLSTRPPARPPPLAPQGPRPPGRWVCCLWGGGEGVYRMSLLCTSQEPLDRWVEQLLISGLF